MIVEDYSKTERRETRRRRRKKCEFDTLIGGS